MVNQYQRGVAVEREIIQLLKSGGWDVTRGAGSKGKALGIEADLIATKQTPRCDKTFYMVVGQVKLSKR